MPQTLPISRLIDVSVNLTPAAAQGQDLSTLLVLGSSDIIDVVERLRTYTSLAAVAADFGTNAPEYLSAVLYFGQTPQPAQLKIGRWAEAATHAKLICGSLSSQDSLIATWNAITNGSFKITVDGGAQQSLTGLNFSGALNLNGVATIINGTLAGATCAYNAVYNRFEFTSATTGTPTSTLSFLVAGASGTDVSDNLVGLSTQGGYVANGIALETPLACVTLFDSTFGQSWYAVTIADASITDNDHVAIAGFIEGCNNKHLYGVSTQEAGVLSSVSTTDIAYLLKQAGYTRTLTQYSSSNPYVISSFLGRALTVDFNGQSTVITMMYKQEPGIVAENLNDSQIAALEAKNCNVFVAYNNNTSIVEQGKVASGNFVDEMTGTDWLAVTVMTGLYNVLYTSPTKIPQTDAGTHLLVTTVESICSQGVVNGLLGAGVWGSAGFGSLKQNDFMPKGFYVYAAPVSSQSAPDRAARKSVPIQVAAKLAGAVHNVDVSINVNR